jgi:hypothetical protein
VAVAALPYGPRYTYGDLPAKGSTDVAHPIRVRRRLIGMPTPEVLSLIAAVLLWIGLLATIAPEA